MFHPAKPGTTSRIGTACRSFPGDDVVTYLLVQVHDADDDYIVPAAFHSEIVKCDGLASQ